MEENKNSPDRKYTNSSEKDKIINVTKPRETRSAMDTSRVSNLTLQEQQSLDRLRRRVGESTKSTGRASGIKSIIAIILVIILIVLAVVFIMLIGNNGPTEEEVYDIRMSMQIENKSVLSIISDTGKEELRKISPGEVVPIKAYVRNSESYHGDSDLVNSDYNPHSMYVRFKIKVILGLEDDRYDIIRPALTQNWYVFNADDEAGMSNPQKETDYYYYYKGALAYNQRAQLFSELEFYGPAISCDDGGKYGQIQVIVESTPANPEALINGVWSTAPARWVYNISTGKYDTSKTGEEL